MIITDPKKLSMPQQVQKNKEDIEDIRKIIDGLDVEDNVVVINDISQILTAQELEAIKQTVAFIVYNNHLYLKGKTTSTTAYFDIVFSITVSTAITFGSSEIQVELSNGALSIVNSTVSTYSEAQIDSKLSLKANITYVDNNFASLSGANFTGAITAPSIVENMSGYSFNKAVDNNAARTYYYAGAVKTGNKITFVIFVDIVLTVDAALSGPAINCGSFNIPASIGNKLYPVSIGTSQALASSAILANTNYINTGKTVFASVSKVSSTLINFSFFVPDATPAGTRLTVRFENTFLLSDNLAS